MKKLFTLTLTLFILSSAFSQKIISTVSFLKPAITVSFGHRYVEMYSFTKNERDNRIANINADYYMQVKQVLNLRISASKKVDLIQALQKERSNRIQNVNERFFDYRNKFNYNHYDRYYNWIK